MAEGFGFELRRDDGTELDYRAMLEMTHARVAGVSSVTVDEVPAPE